MDLNRFEQLAEAARREHAPRIDVARRVVATVESFERPPNVLRLAMADSPLLAFAGLSLAAAVLVGVLALPCWESVQDPLVAFCRPLSAILK